MKRTVKISVLLALVASAGFLGAAEGTIRWESFAEKDGWRYLRPGTQTAGRVWEKVTNPKAASDV